MSLSITTGLSDAEQQTHYDALEALVTGAAGIAALVNGASVEHDTLMIVLDSEDSCEHAFRIKFEIIPMVKQT